MNITYLQHSAFLVELEQHLFLFDWVGTPLPILPPHKKLYVFASHAHADHYHPSIFSLKYPAITYVISSDIACEPRKNRVICYPNHRYVIDDFQVETLRSTDEGVGFSITCEQKRMYFAGDLNWWDWGEEDSPAAAKEMEEAYRNEMEKLRGRYFDAAFIPVDPRLSDGYYKGVTCFMDHADAKWIIPMHVWGQYDIIDHLRERKECQAYRDRIIKFHHTSEMVDI